MMFRDMDSSKTVLDEFKQHAVDTNPHDIAGLGQSHLDLGALFYYANRAWNRGIYYSKSAVSVCLSVPPSVCHTRRLRHNGKVMLNWKMVQFFLAHSVVPPYGAWGEVRYALRCLFEE